MDTIKAQWLKEQEELKGKLITQDVDIHNKSDVQYVGGVDISFIKGNNVDAQCDACAAYVILSYPDLQVVYEKMEMVKLQKPYIPGFLAFREVDHLVKLIENAKKDKPNLIPQVIFVDGNGILHPNGLGLASHLGILVDIPTVGIGKKLFLLDGLDKHVVRKEFDQKCKKNGDNLQLVSNKKIVGAAYKSNDETQNPIFVSIGHKISLNTALDIMKDMCLYRIPEPVRQADKLSREYIRLTK